MRKLLAILGPCDGRDMVPPGPPPSATPEALAADALARGEALRALGLVGRADSGLGIMLKGIAYAQLGDLDLAKKSLARALRVSTRPLDRARARAALVEVAMASGDAALAAKDAAASAAELDRLGDLRNASMQRLVQARAEVLLGHLGEARSLVRQVLSATEKPKQKIPPELRAVAFLANAEIAVRGARALEARDSLAEARRPLDARPNELLARELVALETELSRPVARLESRGEPRTADLFAIEDASSGHVMLVDACRRVVIAGRASVPLVKRPVLFSLLLVLARAWPNGVGRDELAMRAFEAKKVNDSHRSRLRVEIGRLRTVLEGLAEPIATDAGYALSSPRDVVVLLPREDDGDSSHIAMLLGDGATWSAQELAEHAGVSKRTVQRALAPLIEGGGVMRIGEARDARYARPGRRIASRMLLLGLVPKS